MSNIAAQSGGSGGGGGRGGEPIARVYLGVMYHFGLWGVEVNFIRAQWHYNSALKSTSTAGAGEGAGDSSGSTGIITRLEPQMAYLVWVLQAVLQQHQYLSMMGVHGVLEWMVRYYWE